MNLDKGIDGFADFQKGLEGIPTQMSQDKMTEWWKYPAASSRGKFYLIKDNQIIGKVRLDSGRGFPGGYGPTYDQVSIAPTDEATTAFFADDPLIPKFGMLLGLVYCGVTGLPIENGEDWPEGRHKGTRIVDSMDFDFGITHPMFSVVPGWANATKTNHLRIKEPQKARRRRKTHKIKHALQLQAMSGPMEMEDTGVISPEVRALRYRK